jgi:hypothetical protein
MAKREVLLSVCDRCHTEEQAPLEKRLGRRHKFLLPPGWMNVAGNTATHTVFDIDLCEDCKGTVLASAGVARRS